jgi:ATP-dependent Clp protease ATP-binding subunit ClpA
MADDEALSDRVLRDPVSDLTTRMRNVLIAAHVVAQEFGHKHIGTEHVFLAILLDGHAIPTQMMESIGARNEVIGQIRTLLASESYNRPASG